MAVRQIGKADIVSEETEEILRENPQYAPILMQYALVEEVKQGKSHMVDVQLAQVSKSNLTAALLVKEAEAVAVYLIRESERLGMIGSAAAGEILFPYIEDKAKRFLEAPSSETELHEYLASIDGYVRKGVVDISVVDEIVTATAEDILDNLSRSLEGERSFKRAREVREKAALIGRFADYASNFECVEGASIAKLFSYSYSVQAMATPDAKRDVFWVELKGRLDRLKSEGKITSEELEDVKEEYAFKAGYAF
jgi:hypothetical protein